MDNIFLVVPNYHILNNIKEKFEENSVLTFTHETEVNRKLSFLDAQITRENEYIKTAVYTKATNAGYLLNYNSICPDRYKHAVITTLLYKAYLISSDWVKFNSEVKRLKQVFVDNNYPMHVQDTIHS